MSDTTKLEGYNLAKEVLSARLYELYRKAPRMKLELYREGRRLTDVEVEAVMDRVNSKDPKSSNWFKRLLGL